MKITRHGPAGLLLSSFVVLAPLPTLRAQVPGAPKAPSIGITLGLKVTTLGFGPEIGYHIGPRLGIRAGVEGVSVSADLTSSGIAYSAKAKWQTIHALLDLYLVGPLRLSGGIVRNRNKLEISADPTIAVQVGTTTYQASDIGTITGTIDWKKAAPYLGVGIGGKGRIGFIMDLGAMVQGSPKLSYTATTSLTGTAKTAFDQEVARETSQVQADLDSRSILKTYPVFGIGIQVKF